MLAAVHNSPERTLPRSGRGAEGTIWYYRELSARGVARLEAAVRHGSYAQSIPRPLGLAIESENF